MSGKPYRNVMLLIADDWSPLAGCYGHPVVRTPHIDAFAREAIVFEQAYCASPSCAASRATILTGLHSHTHGQYGHCHGTHGFRTHGRVVSIPRVLKPLGFKTACVGKLHAEPYSVYPFDESEVGNPWRTGDLANQAGRFLRAAGKDPFYLHVGSAYPHRQGDGFGLDHPDGSYSDVRYRPEDVLVPRFLPDVPEVRKDLADYYGAVARFDGFVGTMLKTVEGAGRLDDTLVIVMSDHGMPFPGAKASSYDTGHHCPLLIRSPDRRGRGLRSRAMISWVDLAPTVYDWCRVPDETVPQNLPGRSLLPILGEPDPPGWDEVYYAHCFHEVTNYFPYRVLRRRRYKYVRNLAHELAQPLPSDLFRCKSWKAVRDQGIERLGLRSVKLFLHREPEELFDLETDPMETVNRMSDPALARMAEEMRRAVITFRVDTQDPWLEPSFQAGEVSSSVPT